MEKEEFKVHDKQSLEKVNVCSICNKLLNVSPIFCVEESGTFSEVCGRCVHVMNKLNSGNKSRQRVYENFAKFFTFPCCNKKFGCNAILSWDEVVEHEVGCIYQTVGCPLCLKDLFPEKDCAWTGNLQKLQAHIENSHKDFIFNPPIFDWIDSKMNTIFFTHLGTQLITVVIKYQYDSKYFCLVMTNGSDIESQCFRYQLELFDEHQSSSVILRKSRLQPFARMWENLQNKDEMLEIDLNTIKGMLNNTTRVSSRFGIVKKHKKEIAKIDGIEESMKVNLTLKSNNNKSQSSNCIINSEMLQELECPICNEYMIPPIYICKTGHSLCSGCKLKINICPNCRSHFSNARNFTLEKLTMKVNYPCRNREIGCSFMTTWEKICNHESYCEFSENLCILTCKWKGSRLAMYNHILEKHPNAILSENMQYTRDITDVKDTFFVMYVHGQLFRICMRGYTNSGLKFNVQHLGMVDGESQFCYQLQIVNNFSWILSITNDCQCVTDILTKAHVTAMTVPLDTIKPFIDDEKYLHYKINITKKI